MLLAQPAVCSSQPEARHCYHRATMCCFFIAEAAQWQHLENRSTFIASGVVTVFEEFPEYLKSRSPGMFWVEEVESFNNADGTGSTYLVQWLKSTTGILHEGRSLPTQLLGRVQADEVAHSGLSHPCGWSLFGRLGGWSSA